MNETRLHRLITLVLATALASVCALVAVVVWGDMTHSPSATRGSSAR
jgi:hypothetical protein